MKTLAIIAQKRGSGKTSVAIHMSACAAQRNLKTAIIDIDPQRSPFGMLTKFAQYDLTPYPNIVGHMAAIAKRPAYVKAMELADPPA